MSDKPPPSALPDRSSAMSDPEAKTDSGALRGESAVMRGMLQMLLGRNPDPVCYSDPKGDLERRRLTMDDFSTPLLELWDDILALPGVGVANAVRGARRMEKVRAEAVSRRCRSVIIDLTGVDVIDPGTADRFLRIASSELLGAECVISGVQPLVAQTLTDLEAGFHGLATKRNRKCALDGCISRPSQAPHRGTAA